MSDEQEQKERQRRPTPIVSRRLRSGEIIEMIFKRESSTTSFVRGGILEPEVVQTIEENGRVYVPYSATNNLLTHRVLLLPSSTGKPEAPDGLFADVKAFIHRYVDLPEQFEEVAAHYVLLTWLHDRWNELPYLRVRGDYGSGKSRFLLTVGSLCWKPIFASGASTVSPIFRLLDEVGGTLVIDEADFWQTDEKAEIVKILNNGSARGFPVLRTDVNAAKEFSPRAFNIFGPKIIATRHSFEDEALESRCLTSVLKQGQKRDDVPVSLPNEFEEEAEQLRNRLLRYRLDYALEPATPVRPTDPRLSGRRAQIIAPMLEVAIGLGTRQRLCAFAAEESAETSGARLRRELVAILKELRSEGRALSVGAVARRLTERIGQAWTDRQVGACIRQLGLSTQKSNGTYRIPPTESGRLDELFQEYAAVDIKGAAAAAGGGAGEESTDEPTRAAMDGRSPNPPQSPQPLREVK